VVFDVAIVGVVARIMAKIESSFFIVVILLSFLCCVFLGHNFFVNIPLIIQNATFKLFNLFGFLVLLFG